MKDFLSGDDEKNKSQNVTKGKKKAKNAENKTKKGKASRVSALANRRRK